MWGPDQLDTAAVICLLSFAFLVAKGILMHSEFYKVQIPRVQIQKLDTFTNLL